MKKFLIATTALTLSAGVAAAEVKLSGDARLGMMYNSNAAIGDANWTATGNTSKTRLEKRVTINLDASTTADNGVTFGARIRLRSEELSANAGGLGGRTIAAGARVFARAGGLTVAGGNILGAIESMPGVYAPSVGLTGLSWGGLVTNVTGNTFNWDAYSSSGAGPEGLEVIYTMGDFTGHISYTADDLRGTIGTNKRIGAYGSYKFQGWTVALGVSDGSGTGLAADKGGDKVVLTVGGKIGDFGVGFGAARNYNAAGTAKVNKFALNGSYTFGATTVSGYVANESVLLGLTKTSYGLGASYDLGGGASVVGGIERTTMKETRADLGVSFRF
ncbi:porin [Gemmobacter sp.]|uniref:porin n=1 Tax=Gemmobacter sp. TaxID=1898957 RepID=UPI002AFDF24D|nr:porin [Gemmobacter sp.]